MDRPSAPPTAQAPTHNAMPQHTNDHTIDPTAVDTPPNDSLATTPLESTGGTLKSWTNNFSATFQINIRRIRQTSPMDDLKIRTWEKNCRPQQRDGKKQDQFFGSIYACVEALFTALLECVKLPAGCNLALVDGGYLVDKATRNSLKMAIRKHREHLNKHFRGVDGHDADVTDSRLCQLLTETELQKQPDDVRQRFPVVKNIGHDTILQLRCEACGNTYPPFTRGVNVIEDVILHSGLESVDDENDVQTLAETFVQMILGTANASSEGQGNHQLPAWQQRSPRCVAEGCHLVLNSEDRRQYGPILPRKADILSRRANAAPSGSTHSAVPTTYQMTLPLLPPSQAPPHFPQQHHQQHLQQWYTGAFYNNHNHVHPTGVQYSPHSSHHHNHPLAAGGQSMLPHHPQHHWQHHPQQGFTPHGTVHQQHHNHQHQQQYQQNGYGFNPYHFHSHPHR